MSSSPAGAQTRISQLFLRSAKEHPERLVIRQPSVGDISYGTAASIVADIVARWRAAGIMRGDRIVLYADKNHPTIYVQLACMTSGVAWVSVSPLFSPAFMQDIFTRIGASWVYTDEAGSRNLRGTDVKTFGFGSGEPYTLGLPVPGQPGEGSNIAYGDAIESLSRENDAIELGAMSFFVTTSGSTGRPKLLACKEKPFWMAEQLKEYLLTYGCDQYSFLLASSTSHGFALNMTKLALDMSGTLCLPTKVDVATPLEEVRTLDCNVLTMTPRVLRSLYRQSVETDGAEGGPIFGKGARALLVAGGKSDVSILKKVVSQKIDPIEHYAASETGVIAVTPPGQWREGYAGRVIPNVEIEVAADGELFIRSPVVEGYFDNPELTREVVTPEGFYRTGDLGEVGADGWVRILGRKRDVFGSVEGSAIFPSRIEELLERLPWVEQAVVVGNGEAYISAMIVLRDAKPEETPATEDGFLDPRAFASAYDARRADLAAVNAELERIEWVVRFNLFAKPFDEAVYTPVGGAKVRRDRAAFGKMFGSRIAELYQPAPEGDPTVVAR